MFEKKKRSPQGDTLIGRIIHNRYRLEERLGVGGMGAVYKGRHLFLERLAAIKIIQPEQRSQEHFRAWFLREARAVNMIKHAHIIDISDYGETEDGLAYLVMELLDGIPLSREMARGPMELRAAVEVIEQICAALARAHDMGVIHRDLKPDNIFLLEQGGRKNFVKILDFGLAKVAKEGRLADEGAVFGTPEYISPEQARGKEATPASDLYSVGVIFYEMLTTRLPFEHKDRDKIFGLHIHRQPPPPSTYLKSISPVAEGIIMRLLSKPPDERYTDAHHLQEEIKSLQRVLPGAGEETRSSVPRTSGVPGAGGERAAPPLPEFAQWAIKSSVFARMVARAYAAGPIPADTAASLDGLWRATAEAARTDGTILAEARRLEKAEKRVGDFKAQIGRKIEELSREMSRLGREITRGQEELEKRRRQALEAEETLGALRMEIARMEGHDAPSDEMKAKYELAGHLQADLEARRAAVRAMEEGILRDMDAYRQIETKIDSHRRELESYLDVLEKEIAASRRNIEVNGAEIERLRAALSTHASFLIERLFPVEECRELFDELEELSKG